MILVCGIPSEPPTRLVLEACERAGVDCRVVNQREAARSRCHLELVDGEVRGRLETPSARIRLEDVTGVYARLTDWQTLPEASERGTRVFHEAFQEWLEIADCSVLNRAHASASNMSKPYQAQWIADAGLEVPETLVTNDVDEVEAFRRRVGRVIFKSVSSVRSIVQELTPRYEMRLELVRYLPVQFQELIEGVDVRVHVVGERVFATEIRSRTIDYRYAGLDGDDVTMRAGKLPGEVEAKCLALSRALDLPLCGIDLKRTDEERYVCFEVNPSPAFSYYEGQTGQPIASAIVEMLAPS